MADAVTWLRHNAPEITPQTNTFPDSGPEALYMSRQFIFAPEEYAVTGTTGNATSKTDQQLLMYANNQYITERYMLDGERAPPAACSFSVQKVLRQ